LSRVVFKTPKLKSFLVSDHWQAAYTQFTL
jgi:hypothetical protein